MSAVNPQHPATCACSDCAYRETMQRIAANPLRLVVPPQHDLDARRTLGRASAGQQYGIPAYQPSRAVSPVRLPGL
jgi:hypothetical protein